MPDTSTLPDTCDTWLQHLSYKGLVENHQCYFIHWAQEQEMTKQEENLLAAHYALFLIMKILLFLVALCSIIVLNGPAPCECTIEVKVYKDGKMVIIEHWDGGFVNKAAHRHYVNDSIGTIKCDSIAFDAIPK